MQDVARLVRRGRREPKPLDDAAHTANLLGVAAGKLTLTDPQAVFQADAHVAAQDDRHGQQTRNHHDGRREPEIRFADVCRREIFFQKSLHGIRRRLGGKGYLSHLGTLLGSAAADKDFTAIHMTWGAVNELTTLTAYHRMIARTNNPPLADILRSIIKQERRHFAFYRAQARVRLAGSRRARRLVRWSLDHLWAPVGTGIRPQVETDFLVTYLFNDADGVVALKEMDGTIAELPGLGGTHYLSGAAERCAERMGLPFGL
jgi:rubrerythrin